MGLEALVALVVICFIDFFVITIFHINTSNIVNPDNCIPDLVVEPMKRFSPLVNGFFPLREFFVESWCH